MPNAPTTTTTDVDVVIIGSGLGGLTAAARLSMLGHRVMLLEQHYLFGGLATWFKRAPGHIFDISLHGFPWGMVKTCRKYWTREIADRIVQLKHIRFDNPQFALSTTFDKQDFTRLLTDEFNVEPDAVERFFKAARGMDFFDAQTQTTRELFQQFFPDRDDVWRLLMEPIAYANGSTLDDPAISYGIVFSNFMNKGVFTFQGGTDQLIKEMTAELERRDVVLRRSTRVDQVLIENGRAVGVRCGDEVIRARAVLSNASITATVRQLIGLEHFSPAYVKAARDVRVNHGSCQVYFGIKKGERIPDIGDLFFTSTHPTFDSDALTAKDVTSRTFSIYYPETRPHRGERYTIVCSTNARYEDWGHLPEDQYKRDKQALIDTTLAALEGYLPGVTRVIDYIDAATPRTFKRYTLHPAGASFGTKFEGLAVSQDLPKEVPGLYHAASVGIIMSGWLGAANYGAIIANKIDHYLDTGAPLPV